MASAAALPNLYQGVEKGSFGYKMLATMGWKEGQGLVRSCFAPHRELGAKPVLRQHAAVYQPGWQLCFGVVQGANKQGIKEHVKVKKKQDALGVGAVSGTPTPRADNLCLDPSRQYATPICWSQADLPLCSCIALHVKPAVHAKQP